MDGLSNSKYSNDVKFEEYYKDSMKIEWKGKYFAYSKVKKEISEEFQNLLTQLNKSSQPGSENKFRNFGNNPEFKTFLETIQPKIKNDVTRVKFFY
jgi:hypothetical protein